MKNETSKDVKKYLVECFESLIQKLFRNTGHRNGEPRELGDLDSIIANSQASKEGKKDLLRREPILH